MSPRPGVSVVVPFAGSRADGERATAMLRGLELAPGDQRLLIDNSGVLAPADDVVPAAGERSPSHARNTGAARAHGEWILFLDADTVAPPDIVARYFAAGEVDPKVGALVGEIAPAGSASTLAARYAQARNFLDAASHLAHPYLPRAAAANLMVRADAFRGVGGFAEGVRAAEDTDFTWRLQRAGWRLELRADAMVGHVYRQSIGELRRQWRAYAAGRAWLAERYPDFRPEPALARAWRRVLRRRRPHAALPANLPASKAPYTGLFRKHDPRFLLIDVLLAVEELIGLRQSNEL